MALAACHEPDCTRTSALDALVELNNYGGQVLGELGDFASPFKHRLVPDNKYFKKKLATQHAKRRARNRGEGDSLRWDCEAWEFHERNTELSRTPPGRARSSSAKPATLAGVVTPALDISRSPPTKKSFAQGRLARRTPCPLLVRYERSKFCLDCSLRRCLGQCASARATRRARASARASRGSNGIGGRACDESRC